MTITNLKSLCREKNVKLTWPNKKQGVEMLLEQEFGKIGNLAAKIEEEFGKGTKGSTEENSHNFLRYRKTFNFVDRLNRYFYQLRWKNSKRLQKEQSLIWDNLVLLSIHAWFLFIEDTKTDPGKLTLQDFFANVIKQKFSE